MLLPLQGANTIWLALPRVSSHLVRLALGCVLMAFQAVPTQGVVSLGSPCPGLCAYGLSGRNGTGVMYPRIQQRPERAAPPSPGQATAGSDTLGIMYTHPPGALKGQKP